MVGCTQPAKWLSAGTSDIGSAQEGKMEDNETEIVPVRLNNGMTLHVEVRDLGGRQKVSDLKDLSLKNVMTAIEGIGGEISGVLQRLEPRKAAIEMGFE